MIAACVLCRVHLRCVRNSVSVFELRPDDEKRIAVWDADLWECPSCGHQTIMGFGKQPLISEPGQVEQFHRPMKLTLEVFSR